LILFFHSLKRLLRNKALLLVMLAAPALNIFVIFNFINIGSNDPNLTVGLVDLDGTALTRMLAGEIAENNQLTVLDGEDQIRSALAGGQVDYALVIDAGFTEALLDNKSPSLRGYSIQESNISLPVKMNVESFISAARHIAAAAGGDRELFYRGMGYYREGSFALDLSPLDDTAKSIDWVLGGIGLLAMSMLFLAIMATIFLLKDRENRTLYRILASPATLRSYMLQNIFSFLVVTLLQVGSVLVVVHFIFGIYLGPSVFNLFIVMAVFAVLCVSFAIGLAGVVRTPRQAGIASSLLITPMCMLGGLFWPREVMPEILVKVGRFMPTSWVIDAVYKVMLGSPLSGTALEILIMLLYALLFFLLGSWRRVDVAR